MPRPLNDNGARICLINFDGDIGQGEYDINEVYSVITATNEIFIMEDPYACINGIIYVLNLKDINLNMASKFTPTFVNNFIQYLEKSLPLRIKHIHMINTPKVFQNIVKIVLSVCSEKIRKRVHIFINLYLFKLFNFICL